MSIIRQIHISPQLHTSMYLLSHRMARLSSSLFRHTWQYLRLKWPGSDQQWATGVCKQGKNRKCQRGLKLDEAFCCLLKPDHFLEEIINLKITRPSLPWRRISPRWNMALLRSSGISRAQQSYILKNSEKKKSLEHEHDHLSRYLYICKIQTLLEKEINKTPQPQFCLVTESLPLVGVRLSKRKFIMY